MASDKMKIPPPVVAKPGERMVTAPATPPTSSGRRAGEDSDVVAAAKINANSIHHLAESIAELAKALRGDESE